MLKHNVFLALVLCVNILFSQETKVMTYNIKYDNVYDTVNNWNDRKEAMVKLILNYNTDILGLQEVLNNQLTYLDDQLADYAYTGVGREDGNKKGEYSPIFYNTLKYKLVKSETFWLSETPDKISTGWDAALERICTYGLFEERSSNKQFWVFNTHFDHRGNLAREKSVELILSKIKSINTNNLPVVLMGDLNLTPGQKPIQLLSNNLTDAKLSTEKAFYGPTGTFNGFEQNRILTNRIDYIFVQHCSVSSYQHIDDRMENTKFISDHLPVLAHLNLN